MQSFNFSLPTELVFGNGRRTQFIDYVKAFNPSKVMILYGGNSIIRSGLLDLIHSELDNAAISYYDLGGVKPNPSVSLVREAIEICRKENVDFILACGGGSVIDSGKAIAAGVSAEDDIWDIISEYRPVAEALPIGVILTLPATASESGAAFVITNDETQQKLLTASPAVRPKFAVIDPELYLTIPPKVYWPGICDMLSHVIERYFSSEPKTELTDGICESVMRNIIRNANRLLKGENTLDVWAELSLSANMAHNGICGWGRNPDWSCHMIEHEMSALYHVTHGAGLTVITPAWMKYIYKMHIPMFAQFAINVMGVEANTRNLEEIAEAGIARLEDFYRSCNMPTKLEQIGITDDSRFEELAKRAVGYDYNPDSRLGTLMPLSWENVVEILQLAR